MQRYEQAGQGSVGHSSSRRESKHPLKLRLSVAPSTQPITFGKKEEQIFLGREISQHRDFSEDTALKIDAEVRRFVDEGYQSAVNILQSNRPALEKIAMALLEREVLDANEIQMIIDGKELPARVNPNAPATKDEVQQVLKPAPGQQQPNVVPERPAQA